jgi:hypothetical protein
MELRKVSRDEAEKHVRKGLGGAFFIMDKTGDTKSIWDPKNSDEVEAAQDLFDNLVNEKGYKAFYCDEDGDRTEEMKSFDKKAGKVVFAKILVGG